MQFKRNKSKVKQDMLSIEIIKNTLNHTDDIKNREIEINHQLYILFYISTLVDQEKLESKVIEPLTKVEKNDDILHSVYSEEITKVTTNKEAINGLMDGFCLLIKKEAPKDGFLFKVAASLGRQVSEILTEKTMLGSHEGLVENLNENINLIRKRIKTPAFTVKNYKIGSEAATDVSLLYLQHLVTPEIIESIEQRLEAINLDFVRSSGDLQDYLDEHTYSPFPQLLVTENPERVAANMMDGKVALLIDGSATLFVLPATFTVFFQSPDDYISRWELGSLFRIIRLLAYINALLLPALYIAVISFHYEIIPTELVYAFQPSLSYVPFRPIVELIGMAFSLELLREASLRLPPSVAATFGIVGAIVVGTAMVEAGFVSYGGLVVIAMTAVSSFVQPNVEMSSSIRVLGFPLMILAATFGFIGIVFGLLIIIIHLSRLTSFGVPYFIPFAPLQIHKFKDSILRTPVWLRTKQSKSAVKNHRRMGKWVWKANEDEDPY